MLKTRNIFVDTEVFISNNYAEGENLKRLALHGERGTISLYLTEITRNEIKNHIREDLYTAQEQINKFRKSFNSHNKVVKNFQRFKDYLDLPKLDLEFDSEELFEKLNHFIRVGKVKDIPLEYANVKDVVEKYFKKQLPFSIGKRHEFPDAIVLSALENWCVNEGQTIYLVSDDQDLANYKSSDVLAISSLKVMLELIVKQEATDDEKQSELNWIEDLFEKNEKQIQLEIKRKFIDSAFEEIGFDLQIANIKIEGFELQGHSLVDDNNNDGYIFQLDYEVDFTCNVTYDDYDESSYDREDDVYHFVKNITRSFKFNRKLSAELAIESDFQDQDIPPIITCRHTSIISEVDLAEMVEHADEEY